MLSLLLPCPGPLGPWAPGLGIRIQATRYHEFMTAQMDHGEAGCPSVEQPSLYSDWASFWGSRDAHWGISDIEILKRWMMGIAASG